MHAVPALLETQRRFLAALYDDAEAGPLASIAGNGLEPAARLRIYRHSCNEIQAGVLRTSYPAVLALVGEAFFEQTARGYRAAYPSHSGNLQTFGQHLADYLTELPGIHELPYLVDVARLEWLRQESALSGDTETSLDDGPDQTGLHPSVRLLVSPYPVLTIWRYASQPTDAGLDLADAGEQVVLWREDDQVAMAALDSASFACIESLARGGTLDDAYQAGCKQDRDFDLAACIESLVDRGLLAALPPSTSHQALQSCQSFNP
ncbi:MAG: putative DNA-binding domain-containing protein [Proteobacteria bacterium]|nr:putative DNA-binding domain-containing protein [Pseudomonadota bacterium]